MFWRREYEKGKSLGAAAFSCVFQGVIPYGAQMLVVISAAAEMGVQLSAFQIMGYLFYPCLLPGCSLVSIFLIKEKQGRK